MPRRPRADAEGALRRLFIRGTGRRENFAGDEIPDNIDRSPGRILAREVRPLWDGCCGRLQERGRAQSVGVGFDQREVGMEEVLEVDPGVVGMGRRHARVAEGLGLIICSAVSELGERATSPGRQFLLSRAGHHRCCETGREARRVHGLELIDE